jgi:beta-phosphoglucomutase-like phosphatase (HAD superfamily)
LVAVPGVAEAITLLREGGMRMGVASSARHTRIRLSLNLTGLQTLFAQEHVALITHMTDLPAMIAAL